MIANIKRQRGVGIVEVMVSVTIGLLILGGVVQLYATSTTAQRAQEGNARIQENLRFLMSTLEEDLNVTGFAGCFAFSANDPNYDPADPVQKPRVNNLLKNNTGANSLMNFSTYVDGFDDNQPSSKTTDGTGSDSLIIRFASVVGRIPLETELNSQTDDIDLDEDNYSSAFNNLREGQVVIVSDCSYADVFMLSEDPGLATDGDGIIRRDTGVVINGQENDTNELSRAYGKPIGMSRAYLYAGTSGAHEYKIDVSAAGTDASASCDSNTPEFCALFRDDVELIEGVEDFQIEFGYQDLVDSEVNNSGFQVSEGDLFFCDPSSCTADNLKYVDRVRITVTLNSLQTAPTNDGVRLLKKTVTRVISIRNQLPLG